jgi:DNA modification methylase
MTPILSKLQVNPNNPRTITSDKFLKLKKSLREFPSMLELRPIIYDENNIVLGGNMRLKALQELEQEGVEIKESWFKKTSELTEEQKREFIIKDNVPFGEWDEDLLANEWSDLPLDEWGVDTAGWKSNEVIEDEPPEVEEGGPVSKLGEVYQLGRHRIVCGDSTDVNIIERLIGDSVVKTVFTSPPYNMGGDMYANYRDNLKSEDYIRFNLDVIKNILPYLRGYIFWNMSYNRNARWEFIEIMGRIIKETGLGFLELIVWDKGHGLPITSSGLLTREYEDILMVADQDTIQREIDLYFVGGTERKAFFNKRTGKAITNYWRVDTNKTQIDDNKACFPVNLPARGVRLTTNEGDIVLDPFLGSGSTLIACEQLGRVCYGVEYDPKLCDVIRRRYAKFIGKEEEWVQITPKL